MTLEELPRQDDSADLVANINAFLAAAREGAQAEEDGVKAEEAAIKAQEVGAAAWRENTKKLAQALLTGRQLHQNDNNAFGAWLKANGLDKLISKNERAGLICIAENLEIAERVLATTA